MSLAVAICGALGTFGGGVWYLARQVAKLEFATKQFEAHMARVAKLEDEVARVAEHERRLGILENSHSTLSHIVARMDGRISVSDD